MVRKTSPGPEMWGCPWGLELVLTEVAKAREINGFLATSTTKYPFTFLLSSFPFFHKLLAFMFSCQCFIYRWWGKPKYV